MRFAVEIIISPLKIPQHLGDIRPRHRHGSITIFYLQFVTRRRRAEDAFNALHIDEEGTVATDDVSAGFQLVFQRGEGGAEYRRAGGGGDFAVVFVRFYIKKCGGVDGIIEIFGCGRCRGGL